MECVRGSSHTQEAAAMSVTTGRCRRCTTELVPQARYCHACGAGVYVADPDTDYNFERLFNYAVDLLCIADTSGYFKVVNPAFEEALGYSVEELLSKPFVEFTHPDDRDVTVAETRSLARGSPTLFFSNRYRRKNGTWVRLHWTAFPEPGTSLIYASARIEEIDE
jgi:PAS domain S-box-containing protein